MTTKKICITALGIALYVALSMTAKIPLINHIALDLGYIVLAVYCYHFGAISGAVVGGCGAVLVSLITSGWFPPGWMLGNILIGFLCGFTYRKDKIVSDILISAGAVVAGVWLVKTVVECTIFSIPYPVKLASNGVAAITDSVVMCVGVFVARKLPIEKIGGAH